MMTIFIQVVGCRSSCLLNSGSRAFIGLSESLTRVLTLLITDLHLETCSQHSIFVEVQGRGRLTRDEAEQQPGLRHTWAGST